jgi:hypothetical protein
MTAEEIRAMQHKTAAGNLLAKLDQIAADDFVSFDGGTGISALVADEFKAVKDLLS